MDNAIMYQAELISVGRRMSAEVNYKANFSSKEKAVAWCKEKLPLFFEEIEKDRNADYYLSIREWIETNGRFMPNAYYEYIGWSGDEQKTVEMNASARNFFTTL